MPARRTARLEKITDYGPNESTNGSLARHSRERKLSAHYKLTRDFNQDIVYYIQRHRMDEALKLFEEMEGQDPAGRPDVITYGILINYFGYCSRPLSLALFSFFLFFLLRAFIFSCHLTCLLIFLFLL
jgi:hypothetical protein